MTDEACLNRDEDGQRMRVDTCIDGDGLTVVYDEVDGEGNTITHCTDSVDGQGQQRFVDGFSMALKFNTSPIILRGISSQF